MQITKNINGHDYTFEVPENYIVAEEISGTYDGYKLTQETCCYCSRIFKKETSEFSGKEVKHIGTLIYNPDSSKITLHKFVDDAEHKFIKGQSYGINNEIIKRLRTFDRILIENKKNYFEIPVAKALKIGNYLHFDKYELQLFIPIEEFKIIEKRGKKSVYKK